MRTAKVFTRLLLSVIILLMISSSVFAISIKVDGQVLATDQNPISDNNRVLVPLRVCADALGAKVDYDSKNKLAHIYNDDVSIIVVANNKEAMINTNKVTLDVPAKIVNSRMMVPFRFVGESFSVNVSWDNINKVVIISTTGTVNPTPPPNNTTDPLTNTGTLSTAEKEMLNALNTTRTNLGKQKLISVAGLNRTAKTHSIDMWTNGFFSHTSPTYGDITKRAKTAGLANMSELIGGGYSDAKSMVAAFVAEASTKKILLDDSTYFIGVGIVDSKKNDAYNGKYCTLIFVKGNTILTNPKQDNTLNSTSITVSGYSKLSSDEITILKLDSSGNYTSRQTVKVTVSGNTFSQKVTLAGGKGKYKILYNNDDSLTFTVQ